MVGWKEWCALPALAIPAIKAKIDTGAKTSALHAFNIEISVDRGEPFVFFNVHPLPKNRELVVYCRAPLIDHRYVSDSGGHREKRYVIASPLRLGGDIWQIEITLANREPMAFRMLLGREALRGRVYINPASSTCQRKLTMRQALALYPHNTTTTSLLKDL